MRKLPLLLSLFCVFLISGFCFTESNVPAENRFKALAADNSQFVRVSKSNSNYLELTNGKLFIPVGINICWPRFVTNEDSVMQKMEHYLSELGKNGGNFTRIWLSAPVFEVERQKAGEYDEKIAQRIDRLISIARKKGIRIKFCFENFRQLTNLPAAFSGSVPFEKPIYDKTRGGSLSSVQDFFTTADGKKLYLKRVEFFAKRYANEPVVFGWELWNEINSVRVEKQLLFNWTNEMLGEVKLRFPNQLVMQSLGSFDSEPATEMYRNYSSMKGNEIAQVHRYLDQGAKLEISKGAMDKLAYDAVKTLKAFDLKKPVLLSEVGAVEAHHAGPSKLYEKDSAGMMFHDYLFAAFFAGAAGPGQSWHWDYYIDKHNLWYHLARFNKSLKGIDPRSEHFEPFTFQEKGITIYGLKGKKTVLLWCRDQSNTWQTELVNAIKPSSISKLSIILPFKIKSKKTIFYDPWLDVETTLAKENSILLPDFKRSCIVRLTINE